MHYDQRVFRVRQNTENGEVGAETYFRYEQTEDRLTGTYAGGTIAEGHLMGRVFPDGHLEFCYHHVTTDAHVRAGQCTSTPHRDEDDRLVLKEKWQWFTGDQSHGTSELIEVDRDEVPD
ncbi:n-acetylglutamate synthase [Longibacter salinarum]|uniref:N-acetylglutamate synthase n=1 Tax=Longibacter salinarum TaxID=1850348 RepID=A0A2A8CU09_9BACT|nr:n-acetylglutamate synthase [Longibacter salinarum]